MKMEPIVSSETSEIRTQTPGNYPKRNKLQVELYTFPLWAFMACSMVNFTSVLVLLPSGARTSQHILENPKAMYLPVTPQINVRTRIKRQTILRLSSCGRKATNVPVSSLRLCIDNIKSCCPNLLAASLEELQTPRTAQSSSWIYHYKILIRSRVEGSVWCWLDCEWRDLIQVLCE